MRKNARPDRGKDDEMKNKTLLITGGICIAVGIILFCGVTVESAGGRSPADDQKHFLSPEELTSFFDTEWSSFYGRMLTNSWVVSPAVDDVAKKILQCRPSYYKLRNKSEMYPYSIRFVSADGNEKIVFFNFRHFSLDMEKIFPHNITGEEQEKFYWDVYQRDF